MAQRYRFGPFLLDTFTGELSRGGAPIVLQPAPTRLLRYLLDHPGELLSRERLLSEVWDARVVDEALSQMLARIRRALDDDPKAPRYVETVPRRGYRFVGAVEVADHPGPSGPASAPARAGEPLVQRADALAVLAGGGPLVTVVGPGGVGKTRLLREHLRGREGVVWCDVALVRDPTELAVLAGHQLGLRLAERAPLDQVAAALGARPDAVVVLDNAEHAVGAARAAAEAWAGRASVRVASRERLGLPGEELLTLEPLGLPEGDSVGAVSGSAAAELFVERARLAAPGFALDAEAAPHVAAILRATGGLPLAIEIAAARLRLLGLADLAARLSAPLDVLSDPRREPRHASLRATIAWSWGLLEAAEREAMTQLSVFRTPFTAAEAEAVLGRTGLDTLDVLDALVEKSLVRPARGPRLDDEVYLDVLAPIRAYVEERRGEALDPAPADRHAAWMARHGSVESIATLDSEPEALRRLTARMPDLLAALEHAVQRDLPVAADLFAALAHLARIVGPLELAARWAPAVLALGGLSHRDRVRVSVGTGRCLAEMSEEDRAEAALVTAREHARRGAPELEAEVEGALARLRCHQGRYDQADAHAAAALSSEPALPGQGWRGDSLSVRGTVALKAGRVDEARRWFDEAIAWDRRTGNRRAEAVAVANRATVASSTGAYGEGLMLVQRALELHRAFGNRHNTAATLVHQADLLAADGRVEEALPVLDEAVDGLRQVGTQRFLPIALFLRGYVLHRLGRLDEAVAPLEEARVLARDGGVRRIEATSEATLGVILVQQGFAEGFARLGRAEATLRELGEPHYLAQVLFQRAEAELGAGRADLGLAFADEARRLAVSIQDQGLVEEIDGLVGQPGAARRTWWAPS